MSTRAHVIIKKKGEDDVYVYHHCDGYPDGVGEDLKRFIIEEGGADRPKGFAKLLNDWDDSFRIDDGLHGDEEYIYVIDLDEKIIKGYGIWGDEYYEAVENGDIEVHREFEFVFNGLGIEIQFHDELRANIFKTMAKFHYGTGSSVAAKILRDIADEIDD